jgi:hypothetical protein
VDEQAAHEFLAELYSLLSAEAEDCIRHEDYTMELPQSGERLRGRRTMREFHRPLHDPNGANDSAADAPSPAAGLPRRIGPGLLHLSLERDHLITFGHQLCEAGVPSNSPMSSTPLSCISSLTPKALAQ